MIVYDIENLVKVYPGQTETANRNITLQIHKGEIFGLLGDNGAGKTTLVRQMVNLLPKTAGKITLFGQPIAQKPLHVPMQVGYMPQDSLTVSNSSLTVEEVVFFSAHLRGLSQDNALQEQNSLLDRWQLKSLRHKLIIDLSGGEKRILQLAIAMAGSPPILILDEPTNNLSLEQRKLVWDTLHYLNQKREMTVIFATYDAIEMEKIVQRVGIMRAGELVALGYPGQLKAEVDQKLRLELFFPPEAPPTLLPTLQPLELSAGRWLIYLDRKDVASTLNRLNLDELSDFRLYSATLEDLYLHYAGHSQLSSFEPQASDSVYPNLP
jgi:ABC-type multidrug transport system ATPase subunit